MGPSWLSSATDGWKPSRVLTDSAQSLQGGATPPALPPAPWHPSRRGPSPRGHPRRMRRLPSSVYSTWAGQLPAQRAECSATWPGPYTWVVPAESAPPWLRGNHDSVAVRVTAHPGVQALCHAFGGALVSTSANVSGKPPARDALALRQQFGRGLDYILPGRLGGDGKPSEIRDARTGIVLRKR